MSQIKLSTKSISTLPITFSSDPVQIVGENADFLICEITYDVDPIAAIEKPPSVEISFQNHAPIQSTSVFSPSRGLVSTTSRAATNLEKLSSQGATAASAIAAGSNSPSSPFTATGAGSVPSLTNAPSAIASTQAGGTLSSSPGGGNAPMAKSSATSFNVMRNAVTPADPNVQNMHRSKTTRVGGFDVVANLQSAFSKKRSNLSAQKRANIKTHKLDPSRGISNELTLVAQKDGKKAVQEATSHSTEISFQTIAEIQQKSPDQATAHFVQSVPVQASPIGTSALASILNGAKAPSRDLVGQSTSTAIDRNVFGVIPVRGDRKKITANGAQFLTPQASLVSVASAAQLTKVVPVVVQKATATSRVTEKIRIPHGAFKDSTTKLKLTVKDARNNILAAKNSTFENSQKLNAIANPNSIPSPTLNVTNQEHTGLNVLNIGNIHKSVETIVIFKKAINTNSTLRIEEKFNYIGEMTVAGARMTRFRDRTNGADVSIYRIIPVGVEGKKFGVFTDAVIKSRGRSAEPQKRVTGLAISATLGSRGVVLGILGIPDDVIAITPVRRDRTLHQKDFEILKVEPIRYQTVKSKSITLQDFDLKYDHIYEYSCKLMYRDSIERISHARELIKYTRKKASGLSPKISNKKISKIPKASKQKDVSFNITTAKETSEIEFLRERFVERGFESFFDDEIAKEKDKISEIVTYRVLRTDLMTGEVADFGTLKSGSDEEATFVDSKENRGTTISTPQEGRDYKYVVKTQVRIPDTMLEAAERSVKNKETDREYKFKPAKYLHPTALLHGTITSSTSRKARCGESEFEYGDIGHDIACDFSLETDRPSITNVRLDLINNDDVKIKWHCDNMNMIDHFVVKRIDPTAQTIIGKIHAGSNKERIVEAFDMDVPVGTGIEIFYEIIAILNDYVTLEAVPTRKLRL